MDLWGSCPECERWFSMAGEQTHCPVCGQSPATVVDHDADTLSDTG